MSVWSTLLLLCAAGSQKPADSHSYLSKSQWRWLNWALPARELPSSQHGMLRGASGFSSAPQTQVTAGLVAFLLLPELTSSVCPLQPQGPASLQMLNQGISRLLWFVELDNSSSGIQAPERFWIYTANCRLHFLIALHGNLSGGPQIPGGWADQRLISTVAGLHPHSW